MGLDMYLEAQRTLSGHNYRPRRERKSHHTAAVKLLRLPSGINPDDIGLAHVSATVAYWRKANAIHNWFVKNVQDGEDNCQRSFVTREQLRELLNTAKQALEHYQKGEYEKCEELLPPTDGFFFGDTSIDEGYEQDLGNTIRQLEPLVNNTENDLDYYYQASW